MLRVWKMLSCESSTVHHGYYVYFVDKTISGSSVDESVVWLSVFAFFPSN